MRSPFLGGFFGRGSRPVRSAPCMDLTTLRRLRLSRPTGPELRPVGFFRVLVPPVFWDAVVFVVVFAVLVLVAMVFVAPVFGFLGVVFAAVFAAVGAWNTGDSAASGGPALRVTFRERLRGSVIL